MALGSIFGENWTLKTYGSKTMRFNGEMSMYIENAVWSKMYKRSLFNISASLDGINSLFSSCYAPNVFDVSITLNAEGITGGVNGDFLITEFYEPIETFFSTSIISRILGPHDIMLVSSTTNTDDDGQTTLVNDNGVIDQYINKSFNSSKTYRVYFPTISSGGTGDGGSNEENDIIDVINLSKLYTISLSCQDKLYTVKATSLT